MITVKIEFYGVLEQLCGGRNGELTLAAGKATVGDALSRLAEVYPPLARHRAQIACAVDAELTDEAARLRDGAVLALLPPVSGG